MKRKIIFIFLLFIFGLFFVTNVYAEEANIDEMVSNMSDEEKIAQMIMPSFRKPSGEKVNEENIKELVSSYGFAGVILFAENTPTVEDTMRFVDLLQEANKDNDTQLLISIDQEGGYVTRLSIGTVLPGNMGLTATDDPENAYEAGKIIGEELSAQGINTDFAPVVDVNSNPNNGVIAVRSFSDDPELVAEYSEKFMEGLHEEGVITSLKHYPGYSDTDKDAHTGLVTIDKTYEELKESDLVPYQELIDGGTEMIMTAHIQYPNVVKETYVSKKDGKTYTVPATLSKTFLTDILRDEMGFDGVIVTDALDMKAISDQFGKEEAAIRAINAGANILLMPFTYDKEKDDLIAFIKSLASKIGTEIDETKVDDSVKRVLTLKYNNGLFEKYDGSDLEERIDKAKKIVSSKENHEKEFEIAKEAVTMIKNEGDVLPLDPNDKTIIFYEYDSHIAALDNAISFLEKDGTVMYSENITMYPFYDSKDQLPLETLKEQIEGFDNVVMIRAQYSAANLKDSDLDKMVDLIGYAHENGKKVVFIESQMPYEIIKFTDADALVLTYLANGVWINIDDYEQELPKYGPSIIAGFYMLFTDKENMNGVLPVNIYNIDENEELTDEVVYERGFGLHYYKEYHIINQYYDGDDLVVVSDGDLKDLETLKVDNTNLDESNYLLKSGSTIVTLLSKYLSTLSVGKHILTFVYKDGSVDATFNIKNEEAEPIPDTGVNDYSGLLILSIIGLIGLYVIKKTGEN